MEWYFGTDVARQTLLPKYLNTRINGSVIIFNLYPIFDYAEHNFNDKNTASSTIFEIFHIFHFEQILAK